MEGERRRVCRLDLRGEGVREGAREGVEERERKRVLLCDL